MILVGQIKNRTLVFLFVVLIIGIIGYFDYITGDEFGFSFFYLIPVSFLALYQGTRLFSIVFCSFLAAILWFVSEYFVREYSNIFFPVWNTFVRLIIFNAIGIMLYYLKEKDKQLKLINLKLKEINEEKNKFIGIAAHDLRSPLGAIYSFSEILINDYRQKLLPEILEILELIRKASSNNLSMLGKLLDISTIESGKVVLTITTQDYIPFVQQQISIYRLLAANKEISIVFESEPDRLMLDFDEHYLSEVLSNLLTNAIKYSYKKSEITVRVTLADKNQVLTEVADHGIGVPLAERENLFKFFQTTSTRPTNGEKSTGLGLAIAKQIIVLHKGTIGLKSPGNQGSVFYFQFPIKQ